MQDDFFIDDDISSETVEDARADQADLKNAVLYHTDWTVETLVTQLQKGRIELSPSFQRREAWNIKAKSLLIESIILNFPVPAITLAEKTAGSGFIVVDGKQRLTAIAQFLGAMRTSSFNSFRLNGLTQLTELNGKGYQDIQGMLPRYANAIENYSIRTNVIRGWKNDAVLFSIFHRLNSASVKLSPQELRQSLHPGPFTDFIGRYCETSMALRSIFPGPEPDFRMRDVELAIRFLSLAMFIGDYRGDLKKHLDRTVEVLNTDWDNARSTVEALLNHMETAFLALLRAFGTDGLFKKWLGNGWETRANRAIFDTLMFAALSPEVMRALDTSGATVVRAFKEVSLNVEFRDSVERTTKTTQALFTRLHLFCEALRRYGVNAPIIELRNERIFIVQI